LADPVTPSDEVGVGWVPSKGRSRGRVRGRLKVGPGGAIYLVTSVLVLGAAIYTQANLLFWAFGLMVGGLLVSVVMAWQTLRGVRVQRLMPSHGVAGEALVLRYRVENRSWLPAFGVVVAESWGRRRGLKPDAGGAALAGERPRLAGRPAGWMLHIGPRQALQAEAVCWPLRRGPLKFQRVRLWCSHPFGIVRREIEIEEPGEVLIYPHLYRVDRKLLFSLTRHDPLASRQIDRAGGNEEFYGLRAYRAGDNVKHIDWKRTAKTRALVVKEMTLPSPPRVMILIDLRRLDEVEQHTRGRDRTQRRPRQAWWQTLLRHEPTPRGGAAEPVFTTIERTMSLAASLVCDAHLHGFHVGLTVLGVPAATHPIHHSLAHRTRILESLARLDATARTTHEPKLHATPSITLVAGDVEHHSGGPGIGRGPQASLLFADRLDSYTLGGPADPHTLLRRDAVQRSRRAELHESQREAQAASPDPERQETPCA